MTGYPQCTGNEGGLSKCDATPFSSDSPLLCAERTSLEEKNPRSGELCRRQSDFSDRANKSQPRCSLKALRCAAGLSDVRTHVRAEAAPASDDTCRFQPRRIRDTSRTPSEAHRRRLRSANARLLHVVM